MREQFLRLCCAHFWLPGMFDYLILHMGNYDYSLFSFQPGTHSLKIVFSKWLHGCVWQCGLCSVKCSCMNQSIMWKIQWGAQSCLLMGEDMFIREHAAMWTNKESKLGEADEDSNKHNLQTTVSKSVGTDDWGRESWNDLSLTVSFD